MKASYFAELARVGRLPKDFIERFGDAPEKFFVSVPELRTRLGEKFKELPWGAVGLYTYLDKIKVGLQQLMAGARKWKLNLLDRSDLVALSERASKATGIPLPEEAADAILESILS
jgi:hypothetical protein